MTADHTIPLGDTRWEVWRDLVVRSAGFPAEGLAAWSDPATAAAVDALLRGGADDGADRADRANGADRADGGGDGATPAAGAAAERAACELAAAAFEAQLPLVRQAAADPLLREAITWQNPASLVALDRLDRPQRNSKFYQSVRMVARYWQRYCAKNESIGFFGPTTWSTLHEDGPAVTATPGEGLVRDRWTALEDWAIEAVAASIAAEPDVAPHLPVRVPSSVTVDSSGAAPVARGGHERTASLTPTEHWLLRHADGRARSALAQAAVTAGCARTAGDAAVTVDLLVERGLLTAGFDILRGADPAARLLQEFAVLPPAAAATARRRWDRVDAARRALEQAGGDHAAVARADHELQELFGREVSATTEHRSGQTYAGRRLAFEDTTRDLDLRFGPQVLQQISGALGILLRAAHWWCAHLEQVFTRALLDLLDDCGGGRPVLLSDLLFLAYGLLWGEENLVAAESAEFARRWQRLFDAASAEQLAEGEIRFRSEDLAAALDEVFPDLPLTWRQAHLHSPDLQIAASGVDALRRGEFTAVLGELHTGWASLDLVVTTGRHPRLDELRRAYELDCGSHRVHTLMPDRWPRLLSRLSGAFTGPDDRYLVAVAEPVKGIGLPHVVRSTEAFVHRVDGPTGPRPVLRHDGLEWPLLDALTDLLSLHTVDAFKLVTPAPATPRIVIDQLVVSRRTWRLSCAGTGLADVTDRAARFVAVRRLAARLGLPPRCYVTLGSEVKPFFVDLTSPVLADVLAAMVRSAVLADPRGGATPVGISEALPDLDEHWLPDARGRTYSCELRMQIVERAPHLRGPQAVPVPEEVAVR